MPIQESSAVASPESDDSGGRAAEIERLPDRQDAAEVQTLRQRIAELEAEVASQDRILKEWREPMSRWQRVDDALQASQRELGETNQLLAGILEYTHMLTVFLDPKFNFVWVNRAFAVACQEPPAFFIGKNLFDLYPHPENQAIFRNAVETGRPCFVAAKPFTLADESDPGRRYWDWSLIPVREPSGTLRGLVLTLAEVTERIRAEETLRASSERHRTIIQTAMDGFWLVNLDGQLLQVNETYCRMSGYREDELLRMKISDLEACESPAEVATHIAKVVREGTGRFETRHRRKDGSELDVEVSVQYQPSDGGWLVAFVRDITARKRAEATLRENEAIFSTFLEQSPIHVFFKDADLRVLRLSRSFESMLGIPIEQVVGRSMHELFPAELAESMLADDSRILRDKKRVEAVEELNGRIYETVKFPILVDGRAVMLAGFTTDITEKRQANAERTKLEAQLAHAQRMESVGRLAGGVAHDFNNMLSVMLGNVELALDLVDPASPVAVNLQEVWKAAQRSTDLTRQLLAFARKQPISPKTLDLNETIESMLKMLARLVGENIKIVWDPGESIGMVHMDPTQIHQVLANLCVNARDAIADVGRIDIATARVQVDREHCAEHLDAAVGEYVALMVSDNGTGMDPATLDKLFEPFFTTKELGRGTGLGLSTVHGIVKQNGGHITVESQLGCGTTFRIFLPAFARGSDSLVAAAADGMPDRRGRETVLLVEDEPSLLMMGQRVLESLGYTVIPAGTPGEALSLARQHQGALHLLITDVVMPEMNGRDLAKRVLLLFPEARCLFVSGYTTDAIAHQGVLEPGILFLQKPFSRKELANMVRTALDRQQPKLTR